MACRLQLALFSGLLLFVLSKGTEGGYYESSICGSGQRQSPINFPKVVASAVKPSELILSEAYYQPIDFEIENEHGHTVAGHADDPTQLTAEGALMEGGKYIFNNLHLHWGPQDSELGSDHHISGKTYNAEIHFVHYHSNYSSKDAAVASGDPRAIAVIGILFQEGTTDNPYLQPIITAADNVVDPDQKTRGYGLNLAKLLFHAENRYAYFGHYLGSLTTAPCDEVVMWNVKMNPLPISTAQLSALAALHSLSGTSLVGNYRSTRPINGRTIEYFRVMPNRAF